MGTKLLGFSIGRGSGALKGLTQIVGNGPFSCRIIVAVYLPHEILHHVVAVLIVLHISSLGEVLSFQNRGASEKTGCTAIVPPVVLNLRSVFVHGAPEVRILGNIWCSPTVAGFFFPGLMSSAICRSHPASCSAPCAWCVSTAVSSHPRVAVFNHFVKSGGSSIKQQLVRNSLKAKNRRPGGF